MIEQGTLLQNRYRVIRQIGQGGMGAVYVATDERFRSTVAIKRTFFQDDNLRKAFEREAHLLNHLRHNALPKVSDHFAEDDGQFLVMEFIEGSDLSELMKEQGGAFPVADVLRWADELLDALEYLHSHEPPVVHRDIKPQNLKLTPRGRLVLLDFGLAKGNPTHTHSEANSSVFGFTPNFAPLEQMQGTGTDPRSDIYSLAATLYYLMTGALPTDALTRAAATVKSQLDPLRPAHLAHAQVPASVGRIIRRAMSQDAALRPASAKEMRAALQQAAAGLVTPDARQTPAAVAFARERTVPFDATVVGQPASQSSETYTAVARHAPSSASVSPMRIVRNIIAFLVIACASAGAYLFFSSPTGARPASSEAKTETSPSATAGAQQQSDTTSSTTPQSATLSATPDATRVTDDRPAQTQEQAARAADESAKAEGKTMSDAAQALGAADPNAGASSASSVDARGLSPANGTSTQKPALVIHNPAPATRPAEETQRADDARRAETYPQSQPAYRPDPGYRPPPDGRRPPPPGGHRPPPPHHPPPRRP